MADLAPQSVPSEPPVPPVTTRAALRTAVRWRRQIFAVTWLAYAGFYFVRQAFAVAKLGILDDPAVHGVLTEQVLGVIDAVYLAAYAVGQFLWGMWADRFGPRVVVTVGMLGAVAASCTMGMSSALLVFGGAMAVQGLAQSAGWAPLCKNMGNFFPVRTRGRVLGLWSTNYAFGGLAAPPFLGWWAYQVFDDWHAAFVAGAATKAVVLVVFLVFQRDTPPDGAADAMISCVAAVDFGSTGGAGTAAGVVNGCGLIGAVLGGLLPGFLSGSTLFHGFAAAALLAGLLLLPHWNRRPATAS
ncbi:MFS transporter [Streptomyces sp. NPDC004296]|uniref:MFS transporter n=1 Tax=Streptomyces sp. NPDC004296 TaxID=3364697 RepID=UPI0036D0DD3C